MFKPNTEMEAIVETAPTMMTVFNPHTQEQDPHYAYMAEIQYKRKPPTARLILCEYCDDFLSYGNESLSTLASFSNIK